MAHNVFSSSGPAFYTDATLQNLSNDNVNLADQKDWYGSGNRPFVLQAKWSDKIKHDADPRAGSSKGGAVYATPAGIKWVVAWSNMNGESNKVYIDITSTVVNWDVVESLLDTSSATPAEVNKLGYKATATIDPDSPSPRLTTSFQKII